MCSYAVCSFVCVFVTQQLEGKKGEELDAESESWGPKPLGTVVICPGKPTAWVSSCERGEEIPRRGLGRAEGAGAVRSVGPADGCGLLSLLLLLYLFLLFIGVIS